MPQGFCAVIEPINDGQSDCLQLELVLSSILEAVVYDGLVQKVQGLIGWTLMRFFFGLA